MVVPHGGHSNLIQPESASWRSLCHVGFAYVTGLLGLYLPGSSLMLAFPENGHSSRPWTSMPSAALQQAQESGVTEMQSTGSRCLHVKPLPESMPKQSVLAPASPQTWMWMPINCRSYYHTQILMQQTWEGNGVSIPNTVSGSVGAAGQQSCGGHKRFNQE